MRSEVWGVVAVSVLLLAAAPPAGAFTSCDLEGEYAVAAALLEPNGQLAGSFTFTPPDGCAAGEPGSVAFALEARLVGSAEPISLAGTTEYLVEALTGRVVIGDPAAPEVEGFVGHGGSPANSLVLAALPALAPTRLAGVAVRSTLLAPAGPPGPQGPAGVLGAFDELEDLECTRDGEAGTVELSYTAAGAVLRCVTADRFIDNGDRTVTDTQTGLQWEKKTEDGSVHDVDNTYKWSATATAADGTAFTDFLERVNGRLCSESTCQGLGGHSDWRVPTIDELQTVLLEPFPCFPTPCIDPIFGPTASNVYWSSTTHPVNPIFAWSVLFLGGNVGVDGKGNFTHVRAVRGGS